MRCNANGRMRIQQAGVDHLPLKGLASRELYQSIDMRSLSDLDILIRREQLEKACETMTSLGYRAGKVSKYEHVFENGGAAVELHIFIRISATDGAGQSSATGICGATRVRMSLSIRSFILQSIIATEARA